MAEAVAAIRAECPSRKFGLDPAGFIPVCVTVSSGRVEGTSFIYSSFPNLAHSGHTIDAQYVFVS